MTRRQRKRAEVLEGLRVRRFQSAQARLSRREGRTVNRVDLRRCQLVMTNGKRIDVGPYSVIMFQRRMMLTW